ncbi:MAG TPA: ATP synthase F0 subunit B [Candidatus Cybelea sp.]|nr:ATP synthase F0 subunit B [Candidatus Cybelea sp.]
MSFLAIDWQDVLVQLINFAIFFAVLNVIFLRPVSAAIRRRREYINSLVSDYDEYQAQAKSLREQAEGVRASARLDAEQRLAAARAAGSNETAELATRYSQRAASIVGEAQRTVRGELDEARAGESAAARSIADFMLDRVIPEATR